MKTKIKMPKFFDIKSFGIDLTLGFWILTLWLVFVAPLPVRAQLLIESVPEPNDPLYFANQASYFGQIKLWDAWIKTTGSADVIIAIIDSGVDMDHPDLIGNMWFNKKEIPLNGVDDDNNGYVDDLNGWDFLENTSDPHPKLHDGKSFSGLNHGTVVAGIAAAATNNNEGLAGVCWSCKVMALRAVGGDGTGTTEKVALAIDYAIANSADVINMSFVGSFTDEIFTAAVNRAFTAGIVVAAAVGNDAADTMLLGGDLDFRPLYPVCLDGGAGQNHIIGVGSVDSDNRKSSFSNYGFTCIDINAPGNGLASLQVYDPAWGEKYKNKYLGGWRGTSMATPIVAGVAGLMKSINPQLTNEQIIAIIRQTGRNIDKENPLYIAQMGAGLLDAAAAVKLASETPGLGSDKHKPAAVTNLVADLLIAPQSGRATDIVIKDSQGKDKQSWSAFGPAFRGGASTGSGDVDGDGEREIIVGAGPGGGPQVKIYSKGLQLKRQWFAGDKKLRTGVNIAVGDTNGDNIAEIITSVRSGNSNLIKIFDYQGKELKSWTIKVGGKGGNMSVVAADSDNDGQVEIITGAASGALPMVRIFDTLGKKEAEWLAFAKTFRGGVGLAVGDIDANGVKEVITAPLAGGPQIRVFSPVGKILGQFFAFENSFRGGATVAVGNMDADKSDEIIVGAGKGRAAEIRVFSKYGTDFVQDKMFNVFEKNFKGGINLGI